MRLAPALALVLAVAPASRAAADEELGVGLPAPPFALRALNPEQAGAPFIALDLYAGEEPEDPDAKVVLISFFASWCGPCAKEMPFLVQLDRLYRERGLRVLSVAIDRDEAGVAAAKAMAEKAGARHPVLWDKFNLLVRRYLGDEAPLPSVILVARDGNVLLVERGYTKDAPALLLAEVQKALGLERRAPTAGPKR